MTDLQSKLNELVGWCKNQGAKIDSRLKFEYSVEKGIYTVYRPSQDESDESPNFVVEIPRKMLIVPQTARDFFESMVLGFHSELSSTVLLKGYLAYKLTSPEDLKNPYFRLLPKLREIRSPLTYSEAELQLLENTNLYRGTQVRMDQLKTEYQLLMKDIGDNVDRIKFDDFLWGHLILSSRSFPFKIVDENADPRSVMMMPLVDLMNHEPMGRVAWSFTGSHFKVDVEVSNIEMKLANGDGEIEICNNYGPKGNEELLMGYGFVIPDNSFDYLQLSLGRESILKLTEGVDLKQWGVSKLPRLDDYTYSVVTNVYEDPATLERLGLPDRDDEFVVFMCNKDHSIPEGLLELFGVICRNSEDELPTLKSQLNGINKLRESLDTRFKNKLDVMPSKTPEMSLLNFGNCKYYRNGQLKVYNLMKKVLKEKEKQLLKTNRKNLITIKDVVRKDSEEFGAFIQLYQLPVENLNKFEMELFVHLWLFKTVNYHYSSSDSSALPIKILVEDFKRLQKGENHVQKDPFLVDLYEQAITPLRRNKDLNDLIVGDYWDLESFLLVDIVYRRHSYEKGSVLEPVLII
ncbi:hypothetical protein FOA43_001441 [Brettanomyces nanus]|uniref:SET domain-containing protein n=1 Tax=Eeniella nana TaxID=13502 RepID=A0A875S2R9_EENNA|nr:uncharacterized protein FOA43_001441 [Brettanomyces nanus]QPG74119.1 hypothetical protein FOA43_001441 [Brettanomyces nanus]